MGEQDALVAPPVILLGEQLLPCSPGSRAYGGTAERCGSDTAAARYVASRHGMWKTRISISSLARCVECSRSLRWSVVGVGLCSGQSQIEFR